MDVHVLPPPQTHLLP